MANDVEAIFGADIAGLVEGVSAVKEQIEGLAEFTQGIQQTFSELGEALAAAFAVEQLSEFIEKISDLGAKVETASAQLGMSAEKIQGLDYAARISDMGIDQATRTIQKFYESVQEAENPTTKQAAAFGVLGINVQKFLEDGGTLPQLLDETTAKLGTFADGANKSTLETNLFGMRSAETARLINTLSDGLDRNVAVQQALGAPTSETLDQLSEMHIRVVDLETVWENFSQKLAPIGLLAVDAAEGFVEFLNIVKTVFVGVGIEIDSALQRIRDFGQGVEAVFKGIEDRSLSEIKEAASSAFTKMAADSDIASTAIDGQVASLKRLMTELNNPAMKGAGTKVDGQQAPNPPPPHDDDKDQMQAWQAELDQRLMAEQVFGDKAKALEEDYWKAKLATADAGSKEYAALVEKVYSFENQDYQKDVQDTIAAYDEKLKAAQGNYTQVQAIETQKLAYLANVYGQDSKNYQEELRKKQQMDTQHVQQEQQKFQQFFNSMLSSFNSAINGMIKGTETFGQAVDQVLESMLDAILGVLEKWVEQQIATMIFGETSAQAQAHAAIAASAAQAGAAAFASTAAIPIIGPALAPAAGAAAYAGSIAYEGMASYDVGAWNLDSDKIAQVHQGEMIIPRTFADDLRSNGGLPGGANGGDSFHIHAIDTKGMSRFIMQNSDAVAASMRKAGRNGNRNLNG